MTTFDKQAKAFKLLWSSATHNNNACVVELLDKMEPRTCDQNDAAWFLDRAFSGTSSTIGSLVRVVAPLVGPQDDDEATYTAFSIVLDYIGRPELLSAAYEDGDDASNDNADNDSNASGGHAANTSSAEGNAAKIAAKSWIADLQHLSLDTDEQFAKEAGLSDPKDQAMEDDVLRWMVAFLKEEEFKPKHQLAACRKTLQRYLATGKTKRPYVLLTIAQLKAKAQAAGITQTCSKKDDWIAELSKTPEERAQQQQTNNQSAAKKKTKPAKDMPPKLAPLVTLLKQSCLKSLTRQDDQKATAVGHHNEEPFLNAFVKECRKRAATR